MQKSASDSLRHLEHKVVAVSNKILCFQVSRSMKFVQFADDQLRAGVHGSEAVTGEQDQWVQGSEHFIGSSPNETQPSRISLRPRPPKPDPLARPPTGPSAPNDSEDVLEDRLCDPPVIHHATPKNWSAELAQLKSEIDKRSLAVAKNRALLDNWNTVATETIGRAYDSIHPALQPGARLLADPPGPLTSSNLPENRSDLLNAQSKLHSEISSLLQSVAAAAKVPLRPPPPALVRRIDIMSGFGLIGPNIKKSNDGKLLIRAADAPKGNMAIGDAPLSVGATGLWTEVIVKKTSVSHHSGGDEVDGLTLGLTTTDPADLVQKGPPTASSLAQGSWRLPSAWLIGFNGQFTDPSGAWSSTDGYHPATLRSGDRVGLFVPCYGPLRSTLLLYVNEKLRAIGPKGIPAEERQLWLVVDLLGVSQAVTLKQPSSRPPDVPGGLTVLSTQMSSRLDLNAWGKTGSNIALDSSDTPIVAAKKDKKMCHGSLIMGNAPVPWWLLNEVPERPRPGREGDVAYFEIRIKKMSNRDGLKDVKTSRVKTPSTVLLSIGVVAKPTHPTILPATVAQLPGYYFHVTEGDVRVGDRWGFWWGNQEMAVFRNGKLFGHADSGGGAVPARSVKVEKKFPKAVIDPVTAGITSSFSPGCHGFATAETWKFVGAKNSTLWPIVALEGSVLAISLIPSAAPPGNFELLRLSAINAATMIQRWWLRKMNRQKWVDIIGQVTSVGEKEKRKTQDIARVLEKQVDMQQALLEKMDLFLRMDSQRSRRAPDRSVSSRIHYSIGPMGTFSKFSPNLKTSPKSVERLDSKKAWVVLSDDTGNHGAVLVSCDKKSLGLAVVAYPITPPFSPIAGLSLSGQDLQSGSRVATTRPVVDGSVVEFLRDDGKQVTVIVDGKLLGRLHVCSVPGCSGEVCVGESRKFLVGFEFWGGVSGLALNEREKREESWGREWPRGASLQEREQNDYREQNGHREKQARDAPSEPVTRKYKIGGTTPKPQEEEPGPSLRSVYSGDLDPQRDGSDSGSSSFSGSVGSDSSNFLDRLMSMIPSNVLGDTDDEVKESPGIQPTKRGVTNLGPRQGRKIRKN